MVIPPFKLYAQGRAQRGRAADHPQPGADAGLEPRRPQRAGRRLPHRQPAGGRDVRAVRHRDLPLGAGRAAAAQLRRDEGAARRWCSRRAGRCRFTDYICDDGVGNGPYELKLSLTRTGDKVHLDFTGSSPQAAGPINYYINENLTRMFFGIYMITVADPQILWNDGFYPLVDVTIPDGSYWKPKHPASLDGPQPRHRPGVRPVRRAARADQPGAAQRGGLLLVAALHVLRALLRAASARASGSSSTRSASAGSPAGRWATGRTGTRCGRASSNIPCEYLESYYPLRIEKWETVADTGGAGPAPRRQRRRRRLLLRGARHDRDPRRPLADLPVGRQRRAPRARAAPSGSSVPTAPARCCRRKCHDVPVAPRRRAALRHLGRRRLGRPARARPGAGGAGGAARAGHRRRARGATAWCVTERRRGRRGGDRGAARARCAPTGRPSCRCSTWARRSRSCWRAARRRPACRPRSARSWS